MEKRLFRFKCRECNFIANDLIGWSMHSVETGHYNYDIIEIVIKEDKQGIV